MSESNYSILQCTSCGHLVALTEYESLRFPDMHVCCNEMNLKPYVIAERKATDEWIIR